MRANTEMRMGKGLPPSSPSTKIVLKKECNPELQAPNGWV
jgi:hypothetical protein